MPQISDYHHLNLVVDGNSETKKGRGQHKTQIFFFFFFFFFWGGGCKGEGLRGLGGLSPLFFSK